MNAPRGATGAILCVLALVGAGCPGGGTEPGTDAGPGATYDYAVTALTMPAAGELLGLDVDGDGDVDNTLGSLLAFIPNLAPDFDAQATIDMNLSTGTLVLLWDVGDVNDFASDSSIVLTPYPGDPTTTNLSTYTGGGTFAVSAQAGTPSPLNGGIAANGCLAGGFPSGELRTCPGTFDLVLPLSMIDTMAINLSMTLVSARVECTGISETNMTGCLMGGAVTQDDIMNQIEPDLADAINALIPARAVLDAAMMIVPCVADNMTIGDHTSADCAFDPNGICSASNGVDMGICVDSTSGLVGFALGDTVDTNGDGVLTGAELDGLLSAFLVPDLDLEPAGMPDGVPDAISLGFGFETAAATITGL